MKGNKSRGLHSCQKYWTIFLCWFTAPILILGLLHKEVCSIHFMFGYLLPYWLFVMATFAYERYYLLSYLERNHPGEYWKRRRNTALRRGGEYLDMEFLTTFSFEGDSEWTRLQENLKGYLAFVLASFLGVGALSFIVMIFFTAN